MRWLRWGVVGVTLCGMFAGAPVFGAEPKAGQGGEAGREPMEVLQRMADFLAGTGSMSAAAEIGFDVLQPNGQKIEQGEAIEIHVRRPDRIRVEVVNRSGSRGIFLFDGRRLAVFDAAENMYGTLDRSGTIDGAMEHFINGLGLRLPLSDFFRNDFSGSIRQGVLHADYVGRELLGATPCAHIACRTQEMDFQLWVAEGDEPLPLRFVATYKFEPGQPQLWARFSDWSLDAQHPDALFAFTAPEGARQVELSPPAPAQAGPTPQPPAGRPQKPPAPPKKAAAKPAKR